MPILPFVTASHISLCLSSKYGYRVGGQMAGGTRFIRHISNLSFSRSPLRDQFSPLKCAHDGHFGGVRTRTTPIARQTSLTFARRSRLKNPSGQKRYNHDFPKAAAKPRGRRSEIRALGSVNSPVHDSGSLNLAAIFFCRLRATPKDWQPVNRANVAPALVVVVVADC